MINRQTAANAIRVLSADAVERANSGHPGAPMGMADIAEVLWNDFLVHNPANPTWFNRDRFVLSNGHGSMLLYSLLHFTGYDLSIDDIKQFRQLHSKTPGHPEFGYTPGVDTTTGPLGQGIANAVGMAIAEKAMAAEFNTPEYSIVDHYTYAFLGDGCLMEGISHEACSLAGTLGLNKLVAFWDDNGISIDGEVAGWFTDDTPARFRAYGWNVINDVDGHDAEAIAKAISTAKSNENGPTLICCRTIIGKGAPSKQGTETCHGAALGTQEISAMRVSLNWDHEPFVIPDDLKVYWNARERGSKLENSWLVTFRAYQVENPVLAAEFKRRVGGELPKDWSAKVSELLKRQNVEQADVASRKASLNTLNKLGLHLPELMGGSADLASSNLTIWNGSKSINTHQGKGNYINYGVREFGMSAIANGVALHSGFRPYVATFLVFSDYMRNGMRMSALMKQPIIYVLTHDSIGLGEDGPTHQPVEQLSSLRLIPNMNVWRPCDAVETMAAWIAACESTETPTSLVLSRQTLTHQFRSEEQLNLIMRGGYILRDCEGEPDLILIATGSEVTLSARIASQFAEEGKKVRVVSMPCLDVFLQQDESYKANVLPTNVTAKVAIEAGVSNLWYQLVGLQGLVIGVDTFGESAPADQLFDHFGLTADKAAQQISHYLASKDS